MTAWHDRARCFFSGLGPCEGVIIRAHLIPAQRIRREFPWGAFKVDGGVAWQRRERDAPLPAGALFLPVDAIEWDPRVWVPMCGGPTGIGGHHGQFDGRTLSVARASLPPAVEEFAEQFGLEWSLERDYGPREA